MVHISPGEWKIAGAVAGAAMVAGTAYWWLHRKKPTADELEFLRRQTLVSFGRIVDGMVLDGFDVTAEDGTTRNMLLYQYEISGVSYECSQDITLLASVVEPASIKMGMPCSIRYQPGSPENSLLVAERWSGLREDAYVPWPASVVPIEEARKRIAG